MEELKEIKELTNYHIEHLTEEILDFIDDDREGNKDIIGSLKEERERWRDILRIMLGEETYIDYKN